MLSLIAALNTGVSGDAIRCLPDSRWWALGALISQWLDLNEGTEILAFTRHLGDLSRPELVGSIILLLATGHLKMEISLPSEVLSDDHLPGEARFELGMTVVDPLPEHDADEAEELHQIILGKMELLQSAAASVERLKGLL